MDADGTNVRQLTKTKDCYNGGPFFSPDGRKVIRVAAAIPRAKPGYKSSSKKNCCNEG